MNQSQGQGYGYGYGFEGYQPQPQPQPQYPQQQKQPYNGPSTIIANINGNKKVVDFRHKLSAANVNDYAAVHGVGGKDHARKSVISVVVCDYANKDRGGSVTTSANLSVGETFRLYEAAKSFILPSSSTSAEKNAELEPILAKLREITGRCPDPVMKNDLIQVGVLLKQVGSGGTADKAEFQMHKMYLNPYKKNPANESQYAAVYLDIVHASTYKGAPSKYPWFIRIKNGWASNAGSGGKTVVQGFVQTGQAQINVSDEDMFDAMLAVVRFVKLWEQATALPVIMQNTQNN